MNSPHIQGSSLDVLLPKEWFECGDVQLRWLGLEEVCADPEQAEITIAPYGAVIPYEDFYLSGGSSIVFGQSMLRVVEDEHWDFQLLCMYESLRSHFHEKNLR